MPKIDNVLVLSEARIHELKDEKPAVEEFADVLLREAKALNRDVVEQSVRVAVDVGSLSWTVIEDQRKEFVVEKLRAIGNLDESQCNELFDKMDGMVPINSETKRRNVILSMKGDFHETWIMKCMFKLLFSALHFDDIHVSFLLLTF